MIKINLEHFLCPNSRDIENDANSECSSLENEIQKGKWIANEMTFNKNQRRQVGFSSVLQSSKKKELSKKSKSYTKMTTQDMAETEVDVKENLLMPISIDINFSVLGK